ncbi:MAG: hypothetical protein F6K37_34580 [Moorea sp. SIO4E2]|uniref:hypothetical protein n=1 Tax=Moorena sp. SIO4E2 TaxID=2607826 RepID=UPI0013BB8B6E|nr:hypothetical protein [Moorena sp. SIO4E2]NEQ10860.1 hypothetical protein [Moorena sp. SIO4E2]
MHLNSTTPRQKAEGRRQKAECKRVSVFFSDLIKGSLNVSIQPSAISYQHSAISIQLMG